MSEALDPGENWKDRMFKEHALELAEFLDVREGTETLRTVLCDGRAAGDRCAVLDLCCGTGRLLGPLSKFATVVVGLDYSAELLQFAAGKSRRLGNVVLIRGDARSLRDTFVGGQFDAIVRAYTSLGYFPRDVERAILDQCAYIARPGATLLVDSFNAQWFKVNSGFNRRTQLRTFVLEESYEWNHAGDAISCRWRYIYPSSEVVEIPFSLDGYDPEGLRDLLRQSGWIAKEFLDDLTSCQSVSDPSTRERIVSVAIRE